MIGEPPSSSGVFHDTTHDVWNISETSTFCGIVGALCMMMVTSLESSPWAFESLIWYLPDPSLVGFLILNRTFSCSITASTSLAGKALPSLNSLASIGVWRVPETIRV